MLWMLQKAEWQNLSSQSNLLLIHGFLAKMRVHFIFVHYFSLLFVALSNPVLYSSCEWSKLNLKDESDEIRLKVHNIMSFHHVKYCGALYHYTNILILAAFWLRYDGNVHSPQQRSRV